LSLPFVVFMTARAVFSSIPSRDVGCLQAEIELRVLADTKDDSPGYGPHSAPGRARFLAALPREPISPFNQTDTPLLR
jgi:hypothetical protein